MISLTNENAFVGALVKKDGKDLYVYKVNDKTLYVGAMRYELVEARWKNKTKGTTWKDFMASIDGTMTTYDGFTISEDQAVLKGTKTIASKEKRYLSTAAEREVIKLYGRYTKQKGSWKHVIEVGNEIFNIVDATPNKEVLLSIDYDYIVYDIEVGKYTPWIKKSEYKKGMRIPWKVKEEFAGKLEERVSA